MANPRKEILITFEEVFLCRNLNTTLKGFQFTLLAFYYFAEQTTSKFNTIGFHSL